MSCGQREKNVALEKQGENMATDILDLLCLTIRSCRVAATRHHSNERIAGGCNDRIAPPNRPEMALPAFLDVEGAVV